MIKLGSHAIDEIILAVSENFDNEIKYVVDQLSSASIEISSDGTDITDKNGNVIRTVYANKQGTFNSTSALLHPAVMNAGSGSTIQTGEIEGTPFVTVVSAGAKVDVSNADEGTIKVIGLFGNGANETPMTDEEIEAATEGSELTVPSTADKYLVKYTRTADGMRLANLATEFAGTEHLLLYCSYVDPCDDELKACYVYIPSFQPDPNMTINLDRESTEIDFNGIIQTDFCSADRVLYYIYYPTGEVAVKTVVSEA